MENFLDLSFIGLRTEWLDGLLLEDDGGVVLRIAEWEFDIIELDLITGIRREGIKPGVL